MEQPLDFIFVDDIVDLYFEATSKAKKYKGEVFDVASGKITTLKFLANYILQSVNSRSRINWNAFRSVSYDNASWRADIKKTLSCFRWRPKYDIKDGLEKTIEWLKNNPNFYENKKK